MRTAFFWFMASNIIGYLNCWFYAKHKQPTITDFRQRRRIALRRMHKEYFK